MKLARIALERPAALLMIAAAAILCSLFAAPPDLVPAQVVVENPAKPMARDAGRVLALTEVWRITDESGEFYFKYPSNLRIAEDGSIFIADAGQLLRFSPDGNFLKNLYRKGQGPGEIEREFYYHIQSGHLFIHDMNSQRFWRADIDGRFQEQIDLLKKDYRGFLGALPDGFLLLKTDWPPFEERTGKLMEIIHTVVLVGRDGSELRDIATFRPRMFLAPQAAMAWDPTITKSSPDGKHLYAAHIRDYLIEVVDISSGTTIRSYRRQYRKVPYAEKGWEPDFRKKYGAPKMEYEIDISDIFPSGDRLWVVTSTDDKAKGRLIDVFDKDGRFVDSFFLGAGKKLMLVRDAFVICQEKSEAETITIVKYKIDKIREEK
jgi:hypothetical protein